MLLFGHTGITLGAAAAISYALRNNKKSWITSVEEHLDVRLLMVGSLLPDIIDKPLGQVFLGETLSNGRIFGHTVLFLILISAAGIYLRQRHDKIWLLTLALGTFTHLILDRMWFTPQTLFWPFFGFAFDSLNLAGWVPNTLHRLLTDPGVFVPEIIGLIMIIWFGLVLMFRSKIYVFIRYGKVS